MPARTCLTFLFQLPRQYRSDCPLARDDRIPPCSAPLQDTEILGMNQRSRCWPSRLSLPFWVPCVLQGLQIVDRDVRLSSEAVTPAASQARSTDRLQGGESCDPIADAVAASPARSWFDNTVWPRFNVRLCS